MNEVAGRPYQPIDVARVNDQVVRMGFGKGEYPWHKHTNEDELFYVLRGELTIQLRNEADITLREGELAVVPKGVEHRPKCMGSAYFLMFEPYVLQSSGD